MIETEVKEIYGQRRLVFTIPLPNRVPVYMSMQTSEYKMHHSSIVLVDAEKFLQLWRNDPNGIHYDIASGNPKTWPQEMDLKRATRIQCH